MPFGRLFLYAVSVFSCSFISLCRFCILVFVYFSIPFLHSRDRLFLYAVDLFYELYWITYTCKSVWVFILYKKLTIFNIHHRWKNIARSSEVNKENIFWLYFRKRWLTSFRYLLSPILMKYSNKRVFPFLHLLLIYISFRPTI